MTPKEKAQELVDRFSNVKHEFKINRKKIKISMHYDQAKKSALIACDEVIKICGFYDYKIKHEFENTMSLSDDFFATYWQEVKQEIEKL